MVIKKSDLICVEYTGKLESGEIFDSSNHGSHSHPLIFRAGEGQMIPGFDKAVIGMEKGQEKIITLKPEEAYGDKREELTKKVPIGNIPKEAKAGSTLYMQTPQGPVPLTIIEINDKEATIDFNHPLAGKTLIFNIKIVGIGEEDAKKFEDENEHAHSH